MAEHVELTRAETLTLDLSGKFLVVLGNYNTDIVGVLEIAFFGKDLAKKCAQHYFEKGYRVEVMSSPPTQYNHPTPVNISPIPSTSPNPVSPFYNIPNTLSPFTTPPWEKPPLWVEQKPYGTGLGGILPFIESSKGSI